jgi:peptide/nickel transport system substrate-binding protein
MKRSRLASAGALAAGVAMAATACAGGGGGSNASGGGSGGGSGGLSACNSKPMTCNSGKVKKGGTLTYTIEKDVKNWNLNSADGNTFDYQEALDPIVMPGPFKTTPNLKFSVDHRYMTSVKQVKKSPQTIVYKINPKAVWSDGTQITAKDFVYEWKTNNGKDCSKCEPASTSGYDRISSVKGSNKGRTVTVKFSKPFTDWQGLFGPMYPAHIAAKHGNLSKPAGLAKSFKYFSKNVPKWSAGPYKIQSFQDNKAVIEVPNPKWWGKGPHLKKLAFRIITKASEEPDALKNKEVNFIYPQPEVDLVNQIKNTQGVHYSVDKGLQWEHFDLNLGKSYLKNKAVRDAIFTAVDRKTLKNKTVDQFSKGIKVDNSHTLVPGQQGYEDTVTTATDHGQGKINLAKQKLTKAGYKISGGKLMQPSGKPFPALSCKYATGNQIRNQECQLIGNQLQKIGIKMSPKPVDDLGTTLGKAQFSAIVYAWVSDPYPFAGAQQLWTPKGGGDYGKFNNPKVTKMLDQAESQTDRQKAYKLMAQADKLISKGSYALPLYQKPTMIAGYKKYANVRDNPTNVGPPYNTEEWGVSTR